MTTTSNAPGALARAAALVAPALRAAVETITDRQMRLVAGYQLGWWEADGTPTDGHGGKGVRGALAVLSAEAAGADGQTGVLPAVAVELVHNFSLLHDDVMDQDLERRHRPTGWAVFGEGQAILAGTAMLTLAAQVLQAEAPAALPCLLDATQLLISGQSDDLRFEQDTTVGVADVLQMEAGKTAALLACASSIGAIAAGAPPPIVDALAGYGHEIGMAFQLVDDVLGITGNPSVTGKSASSDVRAGKRSAPIVAALAADNRAAARLRELMRGGPPQAEDDVTLAANLIEEAGGIGWALDEADAALARALERLSSAPLAPAAAEELVAIGRYVVGRDR